MSAFDPLQTLAMPLYVRAMENKTRATDEYAEAEAGRISLWLDPSDIEWLSTRCDCPPDASDEQRERCARVRFRARAALHKAGLV